MAWRGTAMAQRYYHRALAWLAARSVSGLEVHKSKAGRRATISLRQKELLGYKAWEQTGTDTLEQGLGRDSKLEVSHQLCSEDGTYLDSQFVCATTITQESFIQN